MLLTTEKNKLVEPAIGGGVVIAVPGTRWRINAEIIAINEDARALQVKGAGFEGWISQEQVKDVLSPGALAFDTAVNVIGGGAED